VKNRFLVTGGSGFIGSRLIARLLADGEVLVFDNLHPQVHGEQAVPPGEVPGLRFFRGDVRDPIALGEAFRISRPTVVYHLAAETGTGQSYEEIHRYCEVNVTGTARLIEAIRSDGPDVRCVVLASSRAVYGEGPYRFPDGTVRLATPRTSERMAVGDFEVRCPSTGTVLAPVASDSVHGVLPSSVYGATKLMQEYLLQNGSQNTAWTPCIFRLQNVYGPGQSLRNPYTGVMSIFCSQLLQGLAVEVYEDGRITRDFVFVDDVVEALWLAAKSERSFPRRPLDIGGGEQRTILEAVHELIKILGVPEQRVSVSGRFRPGDIRFAMADIAFAQEFLGWSPRVSLSIGLQRLAEWSAQTQR
jgi:dTDP-L-rhamnose 4-epimerase